MPFELLAPAGNAAIGRAAIDAGADAVYIGGPQFGARVAAGNSMEEVASLAAYAHGFNARVYLTVNTLLFDHELSAAERLARRAYEAGVDALIVQDMAFTQMNLPPIALHASTQTFNLLPERVAELEAAGFKRVVLERGASLDQIRAIRRAAPGIELEAFVHGAICVSYSGQCYLGHYLCQRGGNRGACAQVCRNRYNLVDQQGKILLKNRALLSVRDLNLSDRLADLAGAGVTSFKIEGRLKEQDYVVNNTAHYHRKMETLGWERLSAGRVTTCFEPNPAKSFSRGFTQWFLDGHTPESAAVSALEPTAAGEPLGRITRVEGDRIWLDRPVGRLHTGDGLCFQTPHGSWDGTNINGVEADWIRVNDPAGLVVGIPLFRNSDRKFRPESIRNIEVDVCLCSTPGGWLLRATANAPQGQAEWPLDDPAQPARNPETARQTALEALSKGGGMPFHIRQVALAGAEEWPFLPPARWNAARRGLLERLSETQRAAYRRPDPFAAPSATVSAAAHSLTHRDNVANSLAGRYYLDRGYPAGQRAFETLTPADTAGLELMRSPYCLRRELGWCLRHPSPDAPTAKKLYLENNGTRLELRFDCDRCEMAVVACK